MLCRAGPRSSAKGLIWVVDILAQVLDAMALRALFVERLQLSKPLARAHYARDEALCLVVLDGGFGLDRHLPPLLHNDALLGFGGSELPVLRPASTGTLLRCRFRLERSLPHPLGRLSELVLARASAITDETELGRIASLLEAELLNQRYGVHFVTTRLAEVLVVEILRRYQLQRPDAVFLAALADRPIAAALDAIHSDPGRGWQVDDLAAVAGLSRGVFAEHFHTLVGEPPLAYLRAWRLLRARRELSDGGARIASVAARAGYRSASGFRRAFRRLFGCAPTQVRRSSDGSALTGSGRRGL